MKKILSMMLVGVMAAAAMSASAFAATRDKYTEMKLPIGYSYTGKGDLANNVLDLGTIDASGLEIGLPLLTQMFQVAAGTVAPADNLPLSATDIRNSKIAVRTQSQSGSRVLASVSIDTRNSTLDVEFVDEWVSTKEQDFEIFIYLTIDGKRQDSYGLTLIGTLENPIIEIYGDYDYVDLSEGYVAEAQEFVNNIEVDLGNGVSIFTKMFKGKSYYGTASREVDEAADIVFKQYPDVDNVVTLKTVGLNSTGDIVRLDTDYSDYYVYDKDLNYLGQSNEMLPYSTVYYLANKKLDILDANEPDEEDEEPDEEPGTNPGTGGDGSTGNDHYNPGTGR